MKFLICPVLLMIAGAPHVRCELKIVQVVNSASYQQGLPAGGGLATIFCSGYEGTPGSYLPTSPRPQELNGVRVIINGARSPVLAVFIPSDKTLTAQINVQVPHERNTALLTDGEDTGAILKVSGLGGVATSTTSSQFAGYGGFFSDATGYAVGRHASDMSAVTLSNPAHPGEEIIVYANDFFLVWPPPPIGFPVPGERVFRKSADIFWSPNLYLQEYPKPVPRPWPGVGESSITHTSALKITFQGLAAGMIGVEQINFLIPANQAAGDWALFFNNGSCTDGSGDCSRVGSSSSTYVMLPVR